MDGPGAASPNSEVSKLIGEVIVGFGEMSFTLFTQMLDQQRSHLQEAMND